MTIDSQNNTSQTLSQGVKFKNYQKKILDSTVEKNRKFIGKEGFTANTNMDDSQNLVAQVNYVQSAAQELKDYQAQFSSLLQRYQAANAELMTTATKFLDSPPPPKDSTIGKNVYVNEVVANPVSDYVGAYTENDFYPAMANQLPGMFNYAGCQNAAINSGNKYFGLSQAYGPTQQSACSLSNSLSESVKYGLAGPDCKQQSDGYLYGGYLTNAIYQTPSAQYVGTFGDAPNRAMPDFANNGSRTFTFETCKKAAVDGGFKLFGLQWYSGGENGFAQCALSNDFSEATKYGSSSSQAENGQGIQYGGGWANAIYAVDSKSSYVGCYNQSNSSINGAAMKSVEQGNGDFSYDTCQQYAIQKGYKYFALQNDGGLGPGFSQCAVSNSLDESTEYGESMPTITFSDGKIYGNNSANAIYEVKTPGFPEYVGNVGYVNNDSKLLKYPMSMLNTNNANNIPSIVNGDISCPTDIVTNIDSIQWKKYDKISDMTSNTKCGLGTAIQADRSSVIDLGNQLEWLSGEIIHIINYLERLDSKIIAQVGLNKETLDSMLSQYTKYNNEFVKYKTGTANSIVSDSKIVVTQENYSYILWMTVAFATLIIVIVVVQRNK